MDSRIVVLCFDDGGTSYPSVALQKGAQQFITESRYRASNKGQSCAEFEMAINTLDAIFTARAQQQPGHVAIEFESYGSEGCPTQTVTYRELNMRADALAHLLRSHGVRQDKLVAMRMERSIGAIVSMLGIMKAGGAYVPIDPTHPKDRQALIFKASCADILVTDASGATRGDTLELPPHCVMIHMDACGIVVNTDHVQTTPHPTQPQPDARTASPLSSPSMSTSSSASTPPTSPTPTTHTHTLTRSAETSLAYVLFTSGSTGTPKGVCLEHQGVVNTLQWFATELELSAHDAVVGLTTFTFDISVLEVFMALLHGARLYLLSSGHQKDPRALAHVLATRGVTVFQATPATYEMLMAVGWNGDPRIRALCGGEAFRLNLAPITMRCRSFWNVYGPTETTIWSTCYKVTSEPTEPLPLGEPISHTHLYILDDRKRPVKQGEQGELYIGGIGLARGYWQRQDLTSERFIPSPFRTGERIYATGDIVLRTPSGVLKYVGRCDNQVKIQGYRVELGEIETVLQRHPDVETAVVVACDGITGKVLVGYIKPKGYTSATSPIPPSLGEHAVKSYLQQSLAPYMVPHHYVYLSHFPLNPNGKIDRNALPKPTVTPTPTLAEPPIRNVSTESRPVARESPMARIIMDVIRERTGVEVGPYFELRALRIDSVSSIVVVGKLQTRLRNFPIRADEFFQHDTVQDLADHLYRRVVESRPALVEELELGDPDMKERSHSLRKMGGSAYGGIGGEFSKHRGNDVATSIERVLAGLRGVLIVWMVCEHWSSWHMRQPLGTRYSTNVNFFAVLSGLSLFVWWYTSPAFKWRPYFYNKMVGIFPAYYLAMALGLPRYIALKQRSHDYHSWRDYAKDATIQLLALYDADVLHRAFDLYYASIQWHMLALYDADVLHRAFDLYYASIQWGLYVMFPIIILGFLFLYNRFGRTLQAWLRQREVKMALYVLLIAASMAIVNVTDIVTTNRRMQAHALEAMAQPQPHGSRPSKGSNMAFVPDFLMGIALAGIYLEMGGPAAEPQRESWSQRLKRELLPASLLAVFCGVVFNRVVREKRFSMSDLVLSYTLVIGIGLSLIFVMLRHKSLVRSLLFESRMACYLGDLSYNIYLLHGVMGSYYIRMAVDGWQTLMPPKHIRLGHLRANNYDWIQAHTWLFKWMCLVLVVLAASWVQQVYMNRVVVPLLVSLPPLNSGGICDRLFAWLPKSRPRHAKKSTAADDSDTFRLREIVPLQYTTTLSELNV